MMADPNAQCFECEAARLHCWPESSIQQEFINISMSNAPERMEHAASEVSEAYSDVFEEEMPDQSADDEATDAASIRSGMTLSRIPDNLPGEDFPEDEAYIQGKWLIIGIQSMPTANV